MARAPGLAQRPARGQNAPLPAEARMAKPKIEDLVKGKGPEAVRGKTVEVHYTGWLTDGTKFDSSVGGDPFSFRLGAGEVI
jgi:peptidylprolyl isomerase/FKBP-type peptidyl-prolyl cis-trans isomerase FkpA